MEFEIAHAMVRRLAVPALALVAACGPAPECTQDDYGCIADHFQLFDKNGNAMPLVKVPGSAIGSIASAGGGGTKAPVPSVMGFPSALSFPSRETYEEISVTFTDPCGDTPGFWFPITPKGQVPSSGHTIPYTYATPAVPDGQTEGSTGFQIGFDFEPAAPQDFSITLLATCATMDQLQALAALPDGAAVPPAMQVSAGFPITANAEVDPEPVNSGGGSCPSPLVPSTLRSGCCATACPAECTDGSQSWYEASGQVFGTCGVMDTGCLTGYAQQALCACNASLCSN